MHRFIPNFKVKITGGKEISRAVYNYYNFDNPYLGDPLAELEELSGLPTAEEILGTGEGEAAPDETPPEGAETEEGGVETEATPTPTPTAEPNTVPTATPEP